MSYKVQNAKKKQSTHEPKTPQKISIFYTILSFACNNITWHSMYVLSFFFLLNLSYKVNFTNNECILNTFSDSNLQIVQSLS